MKILVFGLAALLVMMGAVPAMDSVFAQPAPPLPDGESGDDDHEGKTCPFSGQKLSVHPALGL